MTTSPEPELTGYYCLQTETVRDAPDCTACVTMGNFVPLFSHWLTSGQAWEAMAARVARARPWARCTGADDCPEEWHVHGCFADNGQCSEPLACAATLVSAAVSAQFNAGYSAGYADARDLWTIRGREVGAAEGYREGFREGQDACSCGAQ